MLAAQKKTIKKTAKILRSRRLVQGAKSKGSVPSGTSANAVRSVNTNNSLKTVKTVKTLKLDKNENDSSRQKIMEAAAKLFAENGYEGTSVREISNSAEANLSMISYYFGSKEALYKTVIRDFALTVKNDFDRQIEDYKKLTVSRETFLKVVEGIISHMISHRERWPDINQILEREKLNGFQHSREVFEEVFFPLAEAFRDIVQEAQEKGFVKAEILPQFFFGALIESIKGVMIMMSCKEMLKEQKFKLPKNKNEMTDQFMMIFMKGLLK